MKQVFLTLGLLTAFWSKAQNDSAFIGGYVYYVDDGEPMPFAKVKILNSPYYAVSDMDGTFRLKIPAGLLMQKLLLTAEDIGYRFDTWT